MKDTSHTPEEVDFDKYPNARALMDTCIQFFNEIEDLTPNKGLEDYLNKNYGPGNPLFEDMCRYTRIGLEEGWCANIELDGPKYRRSKIKLPSAETRYLSVTAVYMEAPTDGVLGGDYHLHPYGEINCVVQCDDTAELRGLHSWQGAGWTCPDPGSHHEPQVRHGGLVSLVFLPAGRISYKVTPSQPQRRLGYETDTTWTQPLHADT